MKQITPIVGISKIIPPYDALVVGFDGVITKGNGLLKEALNALKGVASLKKEIIILSNSSMRTRELAELLAKADFDLKNIKAIVTAGEIMHYKLKNKQESMRRYYNIGTNEGLGIFKGLNYQETKDINRADFVFVSGGAVAEQSIEDFTAQLQAAIALNLPMICVGTDVARHIDGEICLASGAIAEQYAAMGGQIRIVGKQDRDVLDYTKEALSAKSEKILFIGDSFLTDMKAAALMGADMVLVSKGAHMEFLGEGYIPDVQKARTLALNFNVYPDYLISELRY